MPFALATIGILLIIAGARGTAGKLKDLLVSDFTGDKNFFLWILSIGGAGALGYIPDFQKFSRSFMTLIILAMIISQKGFFEKFVNAFQGLSASQAPDNPNSLSGLAKDFSGFSLGGALFEEGKKAASGAAKGLVDSVPTTWDDVKKRFNRALDVNGAASGEN